MWIIWSETRCLLVDASETDARLTRHLRYHKMAAKTCPLFLFFFSSTAMKSHTQPTSNDQRNTSFCDCILIPLLSTSHPLPKHQTRATQEYPGSLLKQIHHHNKHQHSSFPPHPPLPSDPPIQHPHPPTQQPPHQYPSPTHSSS
jgi:hypothetical protein